MQLIIQKMKYKQISLTNKYNFLIFIMNHNTRARIYVSYIVEIISEIMWNLII